MPVRGVVQLHCTIMHNLEPPYAGESVTAVPIEIIAQALHVSAIDAFSVSIRDAWQPSETYLSRNFGHPLFAPIA